MPELARFFGIICQVNSLPLGYCRLIFTAESAENLLNLCDLGALRG